MLRSDLVDLVARGHPKMTRSEIGAVVDAFFETIVERLEHGGRVELRRFGVFSRRHRKPHTGRNPCTGETVEVPAKTVPYFSPAKAISERIARR